MTETQCPCESGKNSNDCCEAIILGTKEASSGVELLKARYVAFINKNMDFIVSSHHSETQSDIDRAATEEWIQESTWKNLEIVAESEIQDENKQIVHFKAHYEQGGQELMHEEVAEFLKEDGEWKFHDGHSPAQQPVTREIKIGRNDPCHCGSGKKYKKCCL